MTRYFCAQCGHELTVLKNSVKLVKEDDYVYLGDLYGCKICDFEIVITGDNPIAWAWEKEKWDAFINDNRDRYDVNNY